MPPPPCFPSPKVKILIPEPLPVARDLTRLLPGLFESFPHKEFPCLIEIDDRQRIANQLEVITIDGAPPGEIALYHSPNGGTLILGDALINFEPYGFTFLPQKYCRNQKEMRRSLRKLLGLEVERMLFAHGTPLLSGASGRLRQLLDLDP
jgi:glyoxylase-like metal-dependent hydrolase (beta-lactamase superfamily II)